MSRLKDLRCYLSGPCENLRDSGESWRRLITPKLKELGLVVFDPVHKNGVELSFASQNEKEFDFVKKLREQENYKELSRCMKEVVHIDLRMVDCADLIIVQLDADAPTCGTIDEVVTGCNQRKPIYLCSKQGKKSIPLWLFGRIPEYYIFNNLDEILWQLKRIGLADDSEISNLTDKRWLFSNSMGV